MEGYEKKKCVAWVLLQILQNFEDNFSKENIWLTDSGFLYLEPCRKLKHLVFAERHSSLAELLKTSVRYHVNITAKE